VRYKIKMQGFSGLARCRKSCCREHQIEAGAGAAVPLTCSTFAYYQPQSLVNLLLSKLRGGLGKSEWSREIGVVSRKLQDIWYSALAWLTEGTRLIVIFRNLVVRF
jgi:hypothetical protein